MDNGTLKEVLKVKVLSFTKDEIEKIMNQELEKTPEEMDTELIDMCLDILTGEPKEKTDEELTDSSVESDQKVKKINIKKGLLVVAIVALLVTAAIPVGAKIFDIDVPENILKVYKEHFQLDVYGENIEQDLSVILNENDLNDIVLPRYLYTDCKISDFSIADKELVTKVNFNYVDKERAIKGMVTFNISNDCTKFLDGEFLVNGKYNEAKRITINGINVIVFNRDSETFIVYSVASIEYSIVLNGVTFNEAVEIANTL